MFTSRRTVRNLLAVTVLAAGFGAVAPATAAFAMNQVNCATAGDEFLKVWGHVDRPAIVGGPVSFEVCAANAGTMNLGAWVDQISTGNNDIRYFDANGATVDIHRWTVIRFPNRPPNVDRIQIL
ncbi:MAG TPA: beta/gamma crystallin domain-containing protein [Kineosporiaceae bacterium]